jgi:uncharacterized protein (DUF1330 family)
MARKRFWKKEKLYSSEEVSAPLVPWGGKQISFHIHHALFTTALPLTSLTFSLNNMPAYMLINVTIHDPVKFRDYAIANTALVERMGGKYLVVGPVGDVLEGAAIVGKKVISEWPTKEAALAYWHSPEYAEIRKLRDGICDAQVMLLDGFVPQK